MAPLALTRRQKQVRTHVAARAAADPRGGSPPEQQARRARRAPPWCRAAAAPGRSWPWNTTATTTARPCPRSRRRRSGPGPLWRTSAWPGSSRRASPSSCSGKRCPVGATRSAAIGGPASSSPCGPTRPALLSKQVEVVAGLTSEVNRLRSRLDGFVAAEAPAPAPGPEDVAPTSEEDDDPPEWSWSSPPPPPSPGLFERAGLLKTPPDLTRDLPGGSPFTFPVGLDGRTGL